MDYMQTLKISGQTVSEPRRSLNPRVTGGRSKAKMEGSGIPSNRMPNGDPPMITLWGSEEDAMRR